MEWIPVSSVANNLETADSMSSIFSSMPNPIKKRIARAGIVINILGNSFFVFRKLIIVKISTPDKANDNAVENFIVTQSGDKLFRIEISKIHPSITTEPKASIIDPNRIGNNL